MNIDIQKLKEVQFSVRQQLLQARDGQFYWRGRLSSSALATATAVTAFVLTDRGTFQKYIEMGLNWLCENANEDGGWGDTPDSQSNIATTMLCWAAFSAASDGDQHSRTILNAQSWLKEKAGGISPGMLTDAIYKRYGEDRTFAVPILTMCALTGRLGEDPWKNIIPLPFELAVFPHRLYKWLDLSVVSYALAALIAIGQVHYFNRKPGNRFTSFFRGRCRKKTLKKLSKIQPDHGGFLEAVTLTSFVVMSLSSMGLKKHPVVVKGLRFIAATMRDDGSWPIDTDLATWLTTLSVKALSQDKDYEKILRTDDRKLIQNWLLNQQFEELHLYVHADPGGWAWTDQPGGVPDSDDTAGALVALRKLDLIDEAVIESAEEGLKWLMNLQNKDGGIPTFCRGWKDLPFDRSAPDLTAHAIAAMSSWLDKLKPSFAKKLKVRIASSLEFLRKSQRANGTWIPLWFGNEHADYQENPTYGTSRVLLGLSYMSNEHAAAAKQTILKAARYLISIQKPDGSWGGAESIPSSIEETALATDALAAVAALKCLKNEKTDQMHNAVSNGTQWLIDRFTNKEPIAPSPIGLYFASLWYYEDLYPWVFTMSALQRVVNLFEQERDRM